MNLSHFNGDSLRVSKIYDFCTKILLLWLTHFFHTAYFSYLFICAVTHKLRWNGRDTGAAQLSLNISKMHRVVSALVKYHWCTNTRQNYTNSYKFQHKQWRKQNYNDNVIRYACCYSYRVIVNFVKKVLCLILCWVSKSNPRPFNLDY